MSSNALLRPKFAVENVEFVRDFLCAFRFSGDRDSAPFSNPHPHPFSSHGFRRVDQFWPLLRFGVLKQRGRSKQDPGIVFGLHSFAAYDEVPESTDGETVDPKDRSAERNTRVAVRPGAVHVIAEASHVSFLLFYRGEVVIDW